MAWVKIPAIISLFDEFNRAFPNRDKASDGTIGDGEHSQESSDHNPDETGKTPYEDSDSINEVHAADIDDDLRRAGWSMQRCLDIIVARLRSGSEKRLQNIIYNRRIISRSWGWDSWHAYTGPSAHTEHAHFSFRYGSGSGTSNPENITSPWGILAAIEAEEDMALSEDDKIWLKANVPTFRIDPADPKNVRTIGGSLDSSVNLLLDLKVAVGQLVAAAGLEAAETPDVIAAAVVAKLGTGSSPQAKAALLRAALGADAAEVGRILAA